MFVAAVSLIVVLGVLIFVHELGHFLAAKAVGVGVPRFSIGLGPATPLSFRRGETEFVISWVPLGGYVKMASREETEAFEALEGGAAPYDFPPEKMFENKPLWARMVVILAGVTMNVVFAFLVYMVLAVTFGERENLATTVARFRADALPPGAEALASVPFGSSIVRINGDTVESFGDIIDLVIADVNRDALTFEFAGAVPRVALNIEGLGGEQRAAILNAMEMLIQPVIGDVVPGSAADEAGLRSGDRVLRAAGDSLAEWSQFVARIEQAPQQEIALEIERGDSVFTLPATPGSRFRENPDTGEDQLIGYLGVGPKVDVRLTRYSALAAVPHAAERLVRDTRTVMGALAGLFLGRVSPREVGGPILIGQVAGQFARAGLDQFLTFLAMFSVNLAILNMLPIPVLDGGQFVLLALEGIRGKPLSLELRARVTQVGLFILLGIMVFVMTSDVFRVFGG